MTLIEDFRRELKNILSKLAKEHLREETFKVVQRKDRILSFPKEIARSYLRAIRILRAKSTNMGKFISDKKLEALLVEFLFDLKYGDEVRTIAEIDKHIVGFFDKLKTIQSQRHLFIIPIMHLGLAQNILIGDSMLVNMNAQTLASLETKHSVTFRFRHKELSLVANEMIKENETSVFAVVTVNAPDNERASELAAQRTDTCLNVLRLYYSNAPFVMRDEFSSALPKKIVHVNIDDKTYSEEFGEVNLVTNIPFLNPEAIERMKKGGFEMLNQLLLKKPDKLKQLQGDILTAIFWFGNAVKEENRNMKFIKCIIALETLLVPDGGIGKREILSKRFTSILYNSASEDQKKEAFLTMKSLYDIRNSIIHSGEGYVYEDDLNQIMYWTQATIQFLLHYAEKYKDISELLKQKFPVEEALYTDLQH